ncbi:hypothetical protein COCON_G00162260 [Conger conger]|uniref:Uncharacterized protein n=1 Tax=Conger conger TaxID=82655 RepID=A0A9Q1D6D3_CONCO|nr:hypothetical protein COCON_G00162260 [Conger conger]
MVTSLHRHNRDARGYGIWGPTRAHWNGEPARTLENACLPRFDVHCVKFEIHNNYAPADNAFVENLMHLIQSNQIMKILHHSVNDG